MTGPVVICGARGFVGTHLVRHLQQDGADVRAGSRDPSRAAASDPDTTWVEVDVDKPHTLVKAFEGASSIVYLVHQLRAKSGDLEALEAEGARNVLEAAQNAGVGRIVYLGGPAPAEDASHHLAARLRTGEILRSGSVSTIELRAGMVVGAGSESWFIVRDLALRLPMMILPRWLSYRTQPIGIDDVVAALAAALEMPGDTSRWYDLPGPETLTGRQILERVAAQAGMRPVMIPVPVLTPSLSSHWLRLVTRADYGVARQLVDGLTCDLLADGDGFWDAVPTLTRTSFDEAIRRALKDDTPAELGRLGSGFERAVRRVARSV